jgi:argininosuccinate lyase
MGGMPFRTAHEIVATAAESVGDDDSPAEAAAKVDEAARNVTGEALSTYVSREDVESALDPAASVASRDSAGGPAPDAVADALADAETGIEADEAALASERDALAAASEALDAEVDRYV